MLGSRTDGWSGHTGREKRIRIAHPGAPFQHRLHTFDVAIERSVVYSIPLGIRRQSSAEDVIPDPWVHFVDIKGPLGRLSHRGPHDHGDPGPRLTRRGIEDHGRYKSGRVKF